VSVSGDFIRHEEEKVSKHAEGGPRDDLDRGCCSGGHRGGEGELDPPSG
jgi:hypothetical protein